MGCMALVVVRLAVSAVPFRLLNARHMRSLSMHQQVAKLQLLKAWPVAACLCGTDSQLSRM